MGELRKAEKHTHNHHIQTYRGTIKYNKDFVL